ncbi:MAG TPA: hypothetical protein VNA14_07025, partial [Mycobacteriales bacterium]|nr:hypothetical protein [Mycobacteriales bacterium]
MERLGRAMAGVVVVVASAAMAGCGGEQSPPPRPTSPNAVAERPVVLVHGLGGDPSDLAALVDRLRAAGRRTVAVALPLRGVVPIVESTTALDAALDTAVGPPAGQ